MVWLENGHIRKNLTHPKDKLGNEKKIDIYYSMIYFIFMAACDLPCLGDGVGFTSSFMTVFDFPYLPDHMWFT